MRQHEIETLKYLEHHLPNRLPTIRIRHNKVLVGTKYRPDFVIQQCEEGGPAGPICVVLEVDENGHSLYDPDAEMKREREIAQSLITTGARPVIIRFDPSPQNPSNRPPRRLASRLSMLLDTLVTELRGSATRCQKNGDYKKIVLY